MNTSKTYLLFIAVLLFFSITKLFSQTKFFHETFGTTGAGTSVKAATFTGYSEIGSVNQTSASASQSTTGTGNLGTSIRVASGTQDYVNKSGGNLCFFYGGSDYLLISGINTSVYNDIKLSFGGNLSTATAFYAYYSTNGTDWTNLTLTPAPTSGTTWTLHTATENIPSSTTLSLKIGSTGGSGRIDDVMLTGNSSDLASPILAPAVASVDAPFDVIFNDDAAWRNSISTVLVNGTVLTAGYTITAGVITFDPAASNPAALLQTGSTSAKTILVKATGYTDASVSQVITVGVPAKVGIKTQPQAPLTNGGQLSVQPVVEIQDKYGNKRNSGLSVTATSNEENWVIGGTTTVNAVNGTATFTDLTAASSTSVTGIKIQFTQGLTTSAISSGFDIPSPVVSSVQYTISSGNTIYPNPVKNVLYFADNSAIEQVRIYTVDGRLIRSVSLPCAGIDFSEIENGTYLVKTFSTKGIEIHKIIKD